MDFDNWQRWLSVRPSDIAGAGRGLFASRSIEAGAVIGVYHGRKIHSKRDVYELRDDRYVFVQSDRKGRCVWIDGNVRSNYLRFINGARTAADRRRINVEVYQYAGELRIRATRRIKRNTELILDYGEGYWDSYSNIAGIERRNDAIQAEFETLAASSSGRKRAIALGLNWLIGEMRSRSDYYGFFVNYIWILFETRISRCDPEIVRLVTRLLRLELDAAQFRLHRMFKPTLADKWRFISLIPALYESDTDLSEYAEFFRRHFPKSIAYYDVGFFPCRYNADFEGMVSVLMDYCFLEMARNYAGDSKQFRLPESRFSAYWDVIKSVDVAELEAGIETYLDQFELDYQMTHLVLCRHGYGSAALARRSAFDRSIVDYLSRNKTRVHDDKEDFDLMAEFGYCFQVYGVEKTWVARAIRETLDLQNANGSWGDAGAAGSSAYDRVHATWTALTLLCFSMS